jgi:hypothetical protein
MAPHTSTFPPPRTMLSGAPQLLNINEVVYFILLLLSPFD